MRVRPRSMTGRVAYTGIRVNWGKFLQQWAYAAMWETVAWVRRIKDIVGTCLRSLGQYGRSVKICRLTVQEGRLRAQGPETANVVASQDRILTFPIP